MPLYRSTWIVNNASLNNCRISLGDDRGLTQNNQLLLSHIFDNFDVCLDAGIKGAERES